MNAPDPHPHLKVVADATASALSAKKFLAIGSPKKTEDFFAYFLLYLLHGNDLVCVFLDEDKHRTWPEQFDAQEAMNQNGWERIYAFNASPETLAHAVPAASTILFLSTNAEAMPGQPDYYKVGAFNDELYTTGASVHRVINYKRAKAVGMRDDPPLTLALCHALFYMHSGAWSREMPVSAFRLSTYGFDRLTPQEIEVLGATLMVFESLPHFQGKEAAQLYLRLDISRKTFTDYSTWLATEVMLLPDPEAA